MFGGEAEKPSDPAEIVHRRKLSPEVICPKSIQQSADTNSPTYHSKEPTSPTPTSKRGLAEPTLRFPPMPGVEGAIIHYHSLDLSHTSPYYFPMGQAEKH